MIDLKLDLSDEDFFAYIHGYIITRMLLKKLIYLLSNRDNITLQ